MKNITIIGYGRFGKTLHRLLKDDFDVLVYSRKQIDANINQTQDLKKAYENQTVFYAVPIHVFEDVIAEHNEHITDDHVLIDVLSVKLHPKAVLEKHLEGKKTQALLTHPMFGPDSSKDGFEKLPIVLDKFRTTEETYAFWKAFFKKKQLHVIEITADEHDRLAANSQGVTHFIGRLFDELKLEPTPIDTVGAKKLQEIREQTCNDTWDLFTNLQHFNPYTKPMRLQLGEAYDKLYNKLLPKQVSKDYITIGIQGGKGSFNEEAIQYYLKRNGINNFKIAYLHTTENVMRELHEGTIDQGQFAIHNSIGGIVHESVEAMAKYKFEIIEQFAIKIAHALMVKKGVSLKHIDTIMTHPQVLAQCKGSLSQKYEQLKQTSGEGELIDHALVAQALSEGKLPDNIATMGSKVLADLYNLDIIEDNLQDLHDNYTSFLLVKRI
jgi:arogenate dehydrogenase (NADP+), plant